MPLPQKIKDDINANSTKTDKASYSRKTNIQAYSDTGTRDKAEDIYYRFKEAKKTKMISDSEYALIKRYFSNNEIKAQNAVIKKSKTDLDKIVRTQREKENPVKPAAPANTPPAQQPSPEKPPADLPEIIKPSQVKPNRITDTGTGEYKTETGTTASDYAKEIDWREAQDAMVYEGDRWKNRTRKNNALIFYEPDSFSEQAQDQTSALKKQGYNVDEVAVTSNKQFADYWNANADKYDDIYFLTHGGPHAVSMGEGDENNLAVKNSEYTRNLQEAYSKDPLNNADPDELEYIEDLKKGEFNVHLLSCNAGHLNHENDNVAQAFDEITTGKVYASDGNVSYYPQYLKALEFFNKISPIDIEYDKYPEDKYEPRLSNKQESFYKFNEPFNVWGLNLPGVLKTGPDGFYYLDDGEKEYE